MAGELRCFDDLDAFGAETDDELENLSQDLYHRLIEPPGSNLDDPDRGLGLPGQLSGSLDPFLARKIEAEMRKDPRVNAASAAITDISTSDQRGAQLQINIQVEINEDQVGIVLQVDANGVITRIASS